MNVQSDSQLLRAYAEDRSEGAFAELARRHVDFVYSAALRMVRDPHLAEDVTQGVFVALAKSAAELTGRPVLSGWLHRTARNIAAQTVHTIERRRAREQEAATMNELLAAGTDASWEQIAPHLDAALNELNESDRDALFLRYFERKSAQQMAQVLGIGDEAAQKRVSRAVDRLRELLAKRGVTVGAGGLVVLISTNAVLIAPAGLSAAIVTTTVAGTALLTATTATVGKTIAMTTTQKVLIAATLAAALGTGIYEARQASILRAQIQTLQRQAPATGLTGQLARESELSANQLAALRDENERLNRNTAELMRLRAEVTRLRSEMAAAARPAPAATFAKPNPIWKPFDLSQFPDSERLVKYSEAADVGTATPAALLQTWLWALWTANVEGLKKVWDFPPDAPPGELEREIERVQREVLAREERARTGVKSNGTPYEDHRLIELLPLGQEKYLALVEIRLPATRTYVMKKVFRRVGSEWMVHCAAPTYSPTGD